MSCYISIPEQRPTASALATLYGAVRTPEPVQYEDLPADKVLVCVLENTWGEAALVCLTADDFRKAKYEPRASSVRTWMLLDKGTARTLVPEVYREVPALR